MAFIARRPSALVRALRVSLMHNGHWLPGGTQRYEKSFSFSPLGSYVTMNHQLAHVRISRASNLAYLSDLCLCVYGSSGFSIVSTVDPIWLKTTFLFPSLLTLIPLRSHSFLSCPPTIAAMYPIVATINNFVVQTLTSVKLECNIAQYILRMGFWFSILTELNGLNQLVFGMHRWEILIYQNIRCVVFSIKNLKNWNKSY